MLRHSRLTWVATALAALAASSAAAPQTQVNFTLTYDAYGTPHVSGINAESAYYGAGYSAARDRLFQMWTMRAAGAGRLAEHFGRKAANGTTDFVEADKLARTLGMAREAGRRATLLAQSHPAQHRYLRMYAAGVNRYIDDAVAAQASGGPVSADNQFDPLFATYGINPNLAAEEWGVDDCILIWMVIAREFIHKETTDIFAAGLLGLESNTPAGPVPHAHRSQFLHFYTKPVARMATVTQSEFSGDLVATTAYRNNLSLEHVAGANRPGYAPSFSEAVAVRGDKVTDASGAAQAYMWAAPRITLGAPNPLYEWFMTCPEFTVRGAGPPGSPNMLAGSSSRPDNGDFTPVSWTLCSAGLDLSDSFKITPHPGYEATHYTFHGAARPYMTTTETIYERLDNGQLVSTHIEVKRTRFGPLLPADRILSAYNQGVNRSRAISSALNLPEYSAALSAGQVPLYAHSAAWMVDLAINDNTQSTTPFVAFDAMYRASGVDAFLLPVRTFYSYPGAHMTVADGSGQIGFTTTGAVPARCSVQSHPTPLEAQLAASVPMDGSLLASQWQQYIPEHIRPWAKNPDKGYFVNGNSPGFWNDYPLASYYSAIGDVDERAFELRRFFIERLTSPGSTVDAATIRSFAGWDGRRTAVMLKDLVDFAATYGPPGLLTADALDFSAKIAQWLALPGGPRLDGASEGAVLAALLSGAGRTFELRPLNTRTPNYALQIASSLDALRDQFGARNFGILNFIEEVHRGSRPGGALLTYSPSNLTDIVNGINWIVDGPYTGFYGAPNANPGYGGSITRYYNDQVSKDASKNKIKRYHSIIVPGGIPTLQPGPIPTLMHAADPVSGIGSTLAGVRGAAYNAFLALNGSDVTRRESMLAIGACEKSHPNQPIDPFDGQMLLLQNGEYKPAPCSLGAVSTSTSARNLSLSVVVP